LVNARRLSVGSMDMNRLYVIESAYSITGSVADHRWPVRPSRIESLCMELLSAVQTSGTSESWAAIVARDLLGHRGGCLCVSGCTQSPRVHQIVHQINQLLGNIGTTVRYIPSLEGSPDGDLADLTQKLAASTFDTLLICGGNPVFNSYADADFAGVLDSFSKL